MEFRLGRANITPKNALVATGAAITAIALSGCGESKAPIVIPPDAQERFDGGNDRTFIFDDKPINKVVFDCGKLILGLSADKDNLDPEYAKSGIKGKILGVCVDVGRDWPVERIPSEYPANTK
jgi:predicted small lipoprotein YifL